MRSFTPDCVLPIREIRVSHYYGAEFVASFLHRRFAPKLKCALSIKALNSHCLPWQSAWKVPSVTIALTTADGSSRPDLDACDGKTGRQTRSIWLS
jgi:hypothetical protein